MVDDAVEVGDSLVDVSGRGTALEVSSYCGEAREAMLSYPENLSVNTDWMRTFW